MAELHEALKGIGPTDWSDIPTSKEELDRYLSNLFIQAQIIIDSVPVPAPNDAPNPPHSQFDSAARSAKDITLSSERSRTPPFGHEKLQKEWGKPLKVKASENPLGISMYKMSGKDGKGAWFGRRSVHEGIGFKRFKRAMEIEFEKSLAEPGPPGTGNVRGIGAEKRVEQMNSKDNDVQVLRLSAQFPGPTAARDFVTLLITSDKAVKSSESEAKEGEAIGPRSYTIISKPCNHPETQPQNGFVRGFYESVEFIREVPRRLKSSQSSLDLGHTPSHHSHKKHHVHASQHEHGLHQAAAASTTHVDKPEKHEDTYDPENNPVEWVMVTRSDPGGGIPRFMVERGTPGSICTDAVKFMNWACSVSEDDKVETAPRPGAPRRTSHVAGVEEGDSTQDTQSQLQGQVKDTTSIPPQSTSESQHQSTGGIWGVAASAASILKPITPQVVLDRLPAGSSQEAQDTSVSPRPPSSPRARSIKSQTSFASAEEHWSSASSDGDSISLPSDSPSPVTSRELHHHKELRKLDDRKQALHEKFARTQSKFDEARAKQAEADAGLDSKAAEKHEKELKKHEEKYQKELIKIEKKQTKERKKIIEKKKKAADKDEKTRLTRERDEARQELDIVKQEAEQLRELVAELQKENTALVAKFGRQDLEGAKVEAFSKAAEGGTRSRGSSLSRAIKKLGGDAGSSSSLKSNLS